MFFASKFCRQCVWMNIYALFPDCGEAYLNHTEQEEACNLGCQNQLKLTSSSEDENPQDEDENPQAEQVCELWCVCVRVCTCVNVCCVVVCFVLCQLWRAIGLLQVNKR